MQTNNLEQPVAGSYDNAVSLFNRVSVLGDAQFNEPVYVDGTAELHVADEDGSASGLDASRVELWVNDEFRVVGSEQEPVRIVGWDGPAESNDPLAWWGIFVSDSTGDASGEFVHCEVRNAANGIEAREPVTLRHCLIEECGQLGLSVAEADTVVVDSTTIRGADYGINALEGTTVQLSSSAIEECQWGAAVYKDSRLDATNTSFDGNDTAIYLSKETESWVTGNIRDCDFTNNDYGVWVSGTGDSSVVVEDCSFHDNTDTNMYLYAASVIADNTTVHGAGFGIDAHHGTSLQLSNAAIEDASLFGLYMEKNSTLNVMGTTFNGNDRGLCLAKSTGSWVKGTARSCTFSSNGDGIWLDNVGDSSVVVDGCTISDNTVSGIWVLGNGDVLVTDNTITGSANGVYSYGGYPSIRSGNTIQNNTAGIKCDNYSTAAVESCTVTSNSRGVLILNDANPDLGQGSVSSGYNILKPNTLRYVMSYSSYTISAQQNYWPTNPPNNCNPESSKLYGSIDASNPLCTAPSLAPMEWRLPAGVDAPDRFALSQNYPNPFNPTTTVAYDVPKPGSRVEIALYDVAGRLVATLVEEHKAPGSYVASWDGHDRNGSPVASGVYFLRMRAGQFVATKKLVMLK